MFAFLRAVVQVTFPGYYHKKLGSPNCFSVLHKIATLGFVLGQQG